MNTPAGVSSLGVPWQPQILADELTLFQSGRTDYAHLITNGTPGFSDLPTALHMWIHAQLAQIILNGIYETSAQYGIRIQFFVGFMRVENVSSFSLSLPYPSF